MAQALAPSFAYLVARRTQALRARAEGAGAISQVPFKGAGFYESTGTDVAVRSSPQVTTPWGANVKGTLMPGDVVQADGTTTTTGGITFARVMSVFAKEPVWVATMYLQPSSKTKISGGGGLPEKPVNGGASLGEESFFGSGWGIALGLIVLAVAIYFIAK